MAEADRIASDGLGIPLDTLMENASRQVAAATRAFFDDLSGKDVVALAGKGNNGGDALGALPYLRDAGALIEAFTVSDRDDMSVLAGIRHDALTRSGVSVRPSSGIEDRTIVRRLERADVVIDGLLGYGAMRAPRGEVARLVLLATAAGAPKKTVAVDLPSGLHPDTGIRALDTEGGVLHAALTVTLALPKPGLLAKPARPYIGELLVADIGIPDEAFARLAIKTRGLFAKGTLLRVAF
jgi:NAD(P)H-hydrate epimerase